MIAIYNSMYLIKYDILLDLIYFLILNLSLQFKIFCLTNKNSRRKRSIKLGPWADCPARPITLDIFTFECSLSTFINAFEV